MPQQNTEATSDPDVANRLQIGGTAIPITHIEIPQHTLLFYEGNPRIYSEARSGANARSQEEIQALLCATDRVRHLVQQIRKDGGLTEGIIVRDGIMDVIEGNCRLAAYRILAEKYGADWDKIYCRVIPQDTSRKLIFAILGQFHIVGKLGWEPFGQAGLLYREYKLTPDVSEIAAMLPGMTRGEVEHMIWTYDFMVRKQDAEASHWSYYDEYLKSRDIKKVRGLHPELDDIFAKMVKEDDDMQAMDVRKKLASVCKNPKQVQRVLAGTATLEQAYDALVDSGAEAKAFQKLKRFNNWIASKAAESEVKHARGQEKARIALELKKLSRTVGQLSKLCK